MKCRSVNLLRFFIALCCCLVISVSDRGLGDLGSFVLARGLFGVGHSVKVPRGVLAMRCNGGDVLS